MTSDVPQVFISYSHDSDEHGRAVLALAKRLIDNGVWCELDQFVDGTPPEGWPRWMHRALEKADRVLVVCTETYKRRFEGKEDPGKGKGADWEGILATQLLFESRSQTQKFIPILLDGAKDEDIPLPLRPFTYYRIPEGYEKLYRFVTTQPRTPRPPLGEKWILPPDPR